jgi:hypothetical protein
MSTHHQTLEDLNCCSAKRILDRCDDFLLNVMQGVVALSPARSRLRIGWLIGGVCWIMK